MDLASLLLLETYLIKFLLFAYVFSFAFVERFDGMHGLFYIVSYFSKYSTLRGQNPIDSSIVPPDATHCHTSLLCPLDLE